MSGSPVMSGLAAMRACCVPCPGPLPLPPASPAPNSLLPEGPYGRGAPGRVWQVATSRATKDMSAAWRPPLNARMRMGWHTMASAPASRGQQEGHHTAMHAAHSATPSSSCSGRPGSCEGVRWDVRGRMCQVGCVRWDV